MFESRIQEIPGTENIRSCADLNFICSKLVKVIDLVTGKRRKVEFVCFDSTNAESEKIVEEKIEFPEIPNKKFKTKFYVVDSADYFI